MSDNINTTQTTFSDDQSAQRCEVCGGPPAPGHRICDNCWPEAAIEAGQAAVCARCGRPRLLEKLAKDATGTLVCLNHLT